MLTMYRVIHKSLREFRTLQYNNQDRHRRKEALDDDDDGSHWINTTHHTHITEKILNT
jgi:hypothetical protein